VVLKKEKNIFGGLLWFLAIIFFALLKGYKVSEGGFVELAQLAVLLLIFARSAIILKHPGSEFKLFYMAVSLISLWVLLEEINYGQRIFKYSIPGFFLTHNYQQEFNIHNLSKYTGHIIYLSTAIIGGILVFKRKIINNFLVRFIPKRPLNNLKYIITPPLLYIIIKIIILLAKRKLPFSLPDLDEIFELYFYLTILVFIFPQENKLLYKTKSKTT
jgi:hypothetical protein